MAHEIKIPELGESITEGTIAAWLRDDGASVAQDEPLLELETDKVTMEIVAAQPGRLKIVVQEGETVQVGQVVGTIEEGAATPKSPAPPESKAKTSPFDASEPAPSEAKPTAADQPLSPSVRRLVTEHNIDAAKLLGTGKDGRITKGDVLAFIEGQKKTDAPTVVPPATEIAKALGPKPSTESQPSQSDGKPRQTREKMTRLRKRIAERMVQAKSEAALLTTFNEADMSQIMALRGQLKEVFKEKHNVGLGFMSFFVKASVEALKAVPKLNAQIDGDEIVQNHFYDIGVAVGTEQGLVVPVVRDCDKLSFAQIEAAIAGYAKKARNRTLTLDELTGGCFTISNGGVYGSLLSTPILNPPQSGILGLHAIKKRPMVVGDDIVARPMMYLAMSYDHRIVDGKEAVTFLKRIVECIEHPERIMLEV